MFGILVLLLNAQKVELHNVKNVKESVVEETNSLVNLRKMKSNSKFAQNTEIIGVNQHKSHGAGLKHLIPSDKKIRKRKMKNHGGTSENTFQASNHGTSR